MHMLHISLNYFKRVNLLSLIMESATYIKSSHRIKVMRINAGSTRAREVRLVKSQPAYARVT